MAGQRPLPTVGPRGRVWGMRLLLVLALCLLSAPCRAAEPTVFRDCSDCPDMVRLPAGFALGRTEITVAQYQACVAARACPARAPRWKAADQPMTALAARDAEAYAAWLSARAGHRYRLPSEVEWEIAARAGTVTAFPWGDDMAPGRAVCRDCDPPAPAGPAAVATRAPNPWGLFDMHGNVWEWTRDAWDGDLSRRAVRGG